MIFLEYFPEFFPGFLEEFRSEIVQQIVSELSQFFVVDFLPGVSTFPRVSLGISAGVCFRIVLRSIPNGFS